jgi:hypothetical protein
MRDSDTLGYAGKVQGAGLLSAEQHHCGSNLRQGRADNVIPVQMIDILLNKKSPTNALMTLINLHELSRQILKQVHMCSTRSTSKGGDGIAQKLFLSSPLE